ncbi:MAG TPA: sulfatase-like hydrolase/transferase [Thermoleophilaceae bacterium]|nr:sulfatase-like hydrolase/transferase [Thermoleophilaceae bacterium]
MATSTEPVVPLQTARVPVPVRGLHLGVLYALAVSQPLLNLLGNNADFFTSRQLSSGKVLWFGVVVGLLIPLVLYGVDTVAGLISDRIGWVVHLVLVFALALLLTAQIARKVLDPSAGAIVLAAILAGLITLIYARSAPLRQIATYFSPLPVLVLLLFLFNTPAHRIVFPGSTAAANVTVGGNVPIVFVVFDEFTGTSLLGADNKIDPKLFPNFAALTKDGTYYRNYTAAADETTRVMAGLMTGDMWHEHAIPIAADYPRNLFTLFGKSYRLKVGEEATDLCPVKLCHQQGASSSSVLNDAGLVYLHQIAPKPLEKKLTPVNETLGKFDDDDANEHDKNTILSELGGGGRPARFDQWLQTIDDSVDRTLYFKHVLLPHVPWQYLPSGQAYRTHAQEYIPGINQEPSFGDKWLLQQGYQRHLMQVALVDKMIGRLVARLKRQGIYDKALVIITADNGESFLRAGHDRHVADATTFTDIASTPLLIKLPHSQKGGYDDRHVRTFDIVPTIADATGLKMPWKVAGRSVLRHGDPAPVAVYREQGMKGRVFRTSLADYDAARKQALQRKTSLFSHGLYGVGPHPELIGKAVSTLGGELAPAQASLNPELANALQNVDPNGAFVPANLAGQVTGIGPGTPLALALNGRVAAVGWSAHLNGDKRVYFSFFAPPQDFQKGRNSARIYKVQG